MRSGSFIELLPRRADAIGEAMLDRRLNVAIGFAVVVL
jgi:hypothetical protein